MRRPLPLVLALLLASAAAGCTLEPRGCPPMPAARAGDLFEYVAEGVVVDAFGAVLADWKAVNPRSTIKQGGLNLSAGSSLWVRVEEPETTMLTLSGAPRDAFRVRLYARDARAGDVLEFSDEFLDARTSGAVARTINYLAVTPTGDHWHMVQTGMPGRAGLFLAPLFWQRPLAVGDAGSHAWPVVFYAGNISAFPQESFSYQVKGVERVDGVCQAQVDIEAQLLSGKSEYLIRFALTLGDQPMPLRYEVFTEGAASPFFSMRLVQVQSGAGTPMPAFRDAALPNGSGLQMRDTVDGFPFEGEPTFPTPLAEALDAMRGDEETVAWFQENPSATLASLQHTMGRPGSNAADRWEALWGTASGRGFWASATRIEAFEGAPLQPLLVDAERRAASGAPAMQRAVTLDALAAHHRSIYGHAPEVLSCDMERRTCHIGTHAATGRPYPGESGFGRPGLMVWMDQGWVLQEDSYASAVLGLAPFTPPSGSS